MKVSSTLLVLATLAASAYSYEFLGLFKGSKRADKAYNEESMQKLFKSPEWNYLFQGKPPAERKAAEESSLKAAKSADDGAKSLSDADAKKQADDNLQVILSRLSKLKATPLV
ncbi:hypothetical protein BB560_006949 [Smittium megazygosporum]|uniref:Uncharacterized protein n=1 Tax=Smittium megazygosporum TaxID=133381 RepID=A0A2T9Y033_9FUNG|nr:hypothetical protein BB560_006949 [Smittium megazygosporum]